MRLLRPLVVSTLALLCGVAHAEPAMWLLSDADSKIYLLGSAHALKPDTVWRTPAIETAIADSTALWVETTDMDDVAALQPLVMSLGVDAANPLSARLDAAERARLAAIATKVGLPDGALEPMRPWLAAVTLAALDMTRQGFDPNSGVDRVLMAEARAAGKTVHGLETARDGLEALAGMPPDIELDMLRTTLDQLQDFDFTGLTADWAAGDLAKIEREEIDLMENDFPELYQRLIVDRNRAWTDQILAQLDGAGTALVVVGVGHFVGEDNLLDLLGAAGHTVARVQ